MYSSPELLHVVCKTAVYMFSEQMYFHVCKTLFAVKDC